MTLLACHFVTSSILHNDRIRHIHLILVFQIAVRGGRGAIGDFTAGGEGIFLLGEGNLGRSDFEGSNLSKAKNSFL